MQKQKLSIKTKFARSFGSIILLIGLATAFQAYYSYKLVNESNKIINNYLPLSTLSEKVASTSHDMFESQLKYNFFADEIYLKDEQNHISKLKNYLEQMRSLTQNSSSDSLFSELAKSTINNCEQLIKETGEKEQNNKQKDLATLQSSFIDECKSFLKEQEDGLQKDLTSKSINRKGIIIRTEKIRIIHLVINHSSLAFQEVSLFSLSGNFDKINSTIEKFNEIQTNISQLEQLSGKDTVHIALVKSSIINYKELLDKKISDSKKIDNLGRTATNRTTQLQNQIDSTSQQVLSKALEISTYNKNTGNFLFTLITVSGIFFIILILLIASIILNKMMKSITKSIEFSRELLSGNLNAQIDIDQNDETGELAYGLQQMAKNLNRLIHEVQISANELAEASSQINTTTHSLAEGAIAQAAAAEEVSSSMEEMTANIEQNSENARQTEQISIDAAHGIKQVSESATIAIDSMKKIAQRINIINDIAFQTNILALNAAVEAARAGEHGRGFAVVAAEVRKLAERSKKAAEEIDHLSTYGVDISNTAGNHIAKVLPEIEKTAKLVQEITSASLEQNAGANQINQSVQMLSNITQQNATASEQLANYSSKLSTQAQRLRDIISSFKFDDNKKLPFEDRKVELKNSNNTFSRKDISKQESTTHLVKSKSTTDIKSKILDKSTNRLSTNTINKPVNNTINQTKNSIIQSKPESKGLQSTKTTNLISTKTEVKPFTASKQVVINKKPIEKTILSSKKEESIEQKKTIIPTPRKNYSEGKGVTLNLKDDQHLDEGYERF